MKHIIEKYVIKMKRNVFLLSLLFLCHPSVWGQTQKSMQEQLWEGFHESLHKDLNIKQEKDKKIKEEKEKEIFQSGIEELRVVLAKPHSKKNVQSAKIKITQLRTKVQSNPERKEILSKYEKLISEYENRAMAFCSIFSGEITNPDYERYIKEIETLIPPQMQTLGRIIKAHYDNNGLDSLSFSDDYVYLNAKLAELRNGFKDLDKISDRETLYTKLDAIVKIESEISEEHKTYHALK